MSAIGLKPLHVLGGRFADLRAMFNHTIFFDMARLTAEQQAIINARGGSRGSLAAGREIYKVDQRTGKTSRVTVKQYKNSIKNAGYNGRRRAR